MTDVRLGDWSQQILERIDSSDIFVAVVSPDYAVEGTFSLVEYERAKNVAGEHGWDDYFAPVFLGETLSPAGAELRRFHGFIAKDSQHLAIDNRDLSSWLGCVAQAGLSRNT